VIIAWGTGYPENAINAKMPIGMQISTLSAEVCGCIASSTWDFSCKEAL